MASKSKNQSPEGFQYTGDNAQDLTTLIAGAQVLSSTPEVLVFMTPNGAQQQVPNGGWVVANDNGNGALVYDSDETYQQANERTITE